MGDAWGVKQCHPGAAGKHGIVAQDQAIDESIRMNAPDRKLSGLRRPPGGVATGPERQPYKLCATGGTLVHNRALFTPEKP